MRSWRWLWTIVVLGLLWAGGPAAAQTTPASGLPVILEFGRPNCPICKQMAETLSDLQKRGGGRFAVRFLSIDRDEHLFRQYRVTIVPTQVFLDAHGREVFRHEGLFAPPALEKKLRELKFLLD